MTMSNLPPARACKTQIRDILIQAGGWITTNEIVAKTVTFGPSTLRTDLAALANAGLIDKQCEGPGYMARFKANDRTPSIKDRFAAKQDEAHRIPSIAEQICKVLIAKRAPLTKAEITVLIEKHKKTGVSSILATLHHSGWIGYTPQAKGNIGTFWANDKTASYASRGAQPRAKREVLQDAEPQEPAFKPMYATAIAMPRGMPSFTPLPRQTWEPPRGFDPVIQSRGF